MIMAELRNIAWLAIVLVPLVAMLSVYSFKYHVAAYEATREDVRIFIEGLGFPLRLFFSWNNYGLYYDRANHSPERIASSLYHQRITISVLPIMFVLVSVLGIARPLAIGISPPVSLVLTLGILPYTLFRAWKFGRNIQISA